MRALKAVLALSLLLAAACEAPPGHVAREWSLALRELGITPVFPPREDVQVGDIYFDPVPPEEERAVMEGKGFVPLGTWAGSVPVTTALDEFYGARPGFPRTPEDGKAQPVGTGSVYTAHEKDDWTKRLRLVGFPMFMSATFKSGGLDALIPAEGVAASLGLAGQKQKSVTVSVPRAESCGLPASELLDLILVNGKDPKTNEDTRLWNGAELNLFPKDFGLYLPRAQRRALQRAQEEWPDEPPGNEFEPYAYLRVITEVYYARELDVQVSGASAGGGNLGVKPGTGVPATGQPTPAPAPPAGEPPKTDPPKTDPPTTDGEEPEPTPEEMVKALNKGLEASAQTTPGMSTRFISASRHGVSLRTTFERPVAIGYRFLSLKVYADGRVEGADAIGTAVATNFAGGGGDGSVPTMKEKIKVAAPEAPTPPEPPKPQP